MLVEASEEAFEIWSPDAQILHRLASEKVYKPLHGPVEPALPYQSFASSEFQELGRVDRERRLIIPPPDGDVVPCPVAEGGQRLVGYDFAGADDHHTIAQLLDFAEGMAGEEHGVPGGGELTQKVMQRLLHERVQSTGRLIKYKQTRRVSQRKNQAQFLPHAAGHVAHLDPKVEIELFGQLATGTSQVPAPHGAEYRERIRPIHPCRQAQIPRKVADVAFDRFAVAPAVQSENSRLPAGGTEEAQHDTDGRGFPRAV